MQPIPVEGQSSKLEIAMEEYYNQELVRLEKPQEKVAKDKPSSSKARIGWGQNLKLHLKRAMLGGKLVPCRTKGSGAGCWEEI